ncbi:MAG: LacI family DNA-binding transcriptional regulator [Clostridia bacterium]|nr:LacI family DNA-binding transcriptional regulator [Clostridia bacterium]
MTTENATIYDVASDAGVSIATVSRVLRGESSVSPKTREKVEAAIARRHYRPSIIARSLTGKTTKSLGIVLPKLLNPHYAMIFTGAQEEARQSGYSVSLFPWSSLHAREYDPATMLAERRLDGVIVCVEYLPPDQSEELLTALRGLKRFMPVVLIGCVPPDYDFPAVSLNAAAMTKAMVKYMVSLGHEKIAFIGGVQEDTDPLRRDVGYEEGLKEAKLPCIASYRVYCKGTPEEGKAGLDSILNTLKPEYWPTAVIGLNDLVAMGCQQSAREHGLALPRDLSVMGCDNLFCAPYLLPALTSVDTHQQRVGARAAQMIIRGEPARETMDWEIIHRDSCAAIRENRPDAANDSVI